MTPENRAMRFVLILAVLWAIGGAGLLLLRRRSAASAPKPPNIIVLMPRAAGWSKWTIPDMTHAVDTIEAAEDDVHKHGGGIIGVGPKVFERECCKAVVQRWDDVRLTILK